MDMTRKIGVLPEYFAHLRVHDFMFTRFLEMSVRNDEHVAKISPPKHCPYLHGLYCHRLSSKTRHQQSQTKLVSFVRRPAESGCKKRRPNKEPPRGHLRPSQEREKSSTFHPFSGETVARKETPLIKKKKNRNDTSYEGLSFIAAPAVNSGHPVHIEIDTDTDASTYTNTNHSHDPQTPPTDPHKHPQTHTNTHISHSSSQRSVHKVLSLSARVHGPWPIACLANCSHHAAVSGMKCSSLSSNSLPFPSLPFSSLL